MISLSSYEMDITKELIHIALSNAADAFSKLAKERVLIKGYDLKILDKEDYYRIMEKEQHQQLYVLTTNIKGKLDGKSFLLIDQQDAKKIFKVFSPSHEQVSPEGLSEFQQGILLELDNILTAAMVTQLSNILDLFTYGDVPKLDFFSQSQIKEYFKESIENFDFVLNIDARFQSFDTNMSPSFIWFFKSELLLAVQNLIKEKKHLSLVKNSK